jgi:ABC-type multidrug transport system permease subunit
MRKILDIGHTDVRVFFRRHSAWLWLFVAPLAFVYFIGLANRGPGDPANRRPPVLIENQDTNFLSRIFLGELDAQGMRLVNPTNRESAARGIRIPSDFTEKVLRGEQTKLQFFQREGSGEADEALIELRLVRALIALNSHILEAAALTGDAATNGIPREKGLQTLSEDKLRRAIARPNPVSLNAHFAGRQPVPTGFNFSLPGNLVMYLMMNLLLFGGVSVAALRRVGIMKRFMAAAITRNEIVMGKIYGLMLLGGVQIVFFLVVGKFLFGVNLGANLPAVAFTLLVFAWVGGSLGVLVGSLISTEDRVVGICLLTSLLLAALGGCWWPLEIAPPALKTIALFTPTGWALQALHQLISFGSGFGAVLKPIGILLAFGVAANLLAVRYFRS